MSRKRVPLVARHSSNAYDSCLPTFTRLVKDDLQELPLGSKLNRYEVALLSLSLAFRTSSCVDRVALGAFALHCLKWTDDDPKRELPLSVSSVMTVLKEPTVSLDMCKRDLIHTAVLLVGRGYLALGYLPAASWIYQKLLAIEFSETIKAELLAIDTLDPIGILSLSELRLVVVRQFFLQSGSQLCHVGRLRAFASLQCAKRRVAPLPWWANTVCLSLVGDDLWCETATAKSLIAPNAKSAILILVHRLATMFPKKSFWEQRKELDEKLNLFLADLQAELFSNFSFPQKPGIVFSLILPPLMLSLPVESIPLFRNTVFVRRMGCVPLVQEIAGDPEFRFVLNPGAEGLALGPKWTGRSGPPTLTDAEFIKLLKEADVFLFSGHGGGEKHWSGAAVQRLACSSPGAPTVTLLMGCSSAKPYGAPGAPFCTPFHYLVGGGALVVGTLWDVLGREMDRISVDIVNKIEHSVDLLGEAPTIVANSRAASKLKNLSGAAIVMYGP